MKKGNKKLTTYTEAREHMLKGNVAFVEIYDDKIKDNQMIEVTLVDDTLRIKYKDETVERADSKMSAMLKWLSWYIEEESK